MVRYTYVWTALNLYLSFEYNVDSLIGGQKQEKK